MSIKQELLNIRKRNLDDMDFVCPSCNQSFNISLLEIYCSNSFDCPCCGMHFIYKKSRPF